MTRALATAAALLSAGCLQPLEVEAEIPRACIEVQGIPIPGLDALPPVTALVDSGAAPAATFTKRLEIPLDATLLASAPESTRLSLTDVQLDAVGGSFAFVDRVTVSAAASGAADAVLTPVLQYARTGVATSTLLIQPQAPVDLAAYVRGGALTLEISLTGRAPNRSLALNATTCFSASASWAP